MLCAIYKTRRKEGMYLYVPGKDAFGDVPESLMNQFGNKELVMVFALEKRHHLAGVEKSQVEAALKDKGYYLQMPPKGEDWLAEFRQAQGLPPKPDKKF